MKRAMIIHPFSVVQWHGEDYPYYEEDSEIYKFEVGMIVDVLKEAKEDMIGKLYVIYSKDINESTVVTERYLEFIEEEEK